MMHPWTLLLLSVLKSTVSYTIIDLSHKQGPTTLSFGKPPYVRHDISVQKTATGIWSQAGEYTSEEHSGTHIDAPSHFSNSSKALALDDIPIENTIADGVMVDVSKEASENIEYQVPLSKVIEWERTYGDIPNEAAVIFNFGWHKRFHNKTLYLNTETFNWSDVKFPSVSQEVGAYLYDKRNIKIIGTDTISPDKLPDLPIHVKYLRNNRLIVENLNATDQLPPRGFRFHAAPVKYVDASGAQVRAFAVVYENTECSSINVSWKWSVMAVLIFLSVLYET